MEFSYAYDALGRLINVKDLHESTDCYVYRYGANGAAAEVEDNHLGRIARTDYDQTDRPCQSELKETATGKILYRTLLKYDKFSNLEQFTEKTGDEIHTSKYAYDRDNRVTEIQYDGAAQKVAYTYDDLGRVTARTAECGGAAGKLTSSYTYVDGAYGTNSTTPLVKKITQNGISFEYTYDTRGNIISEKRGNLTTTYAYDALGQLIRVNDPHENATWVYNYDRGGNITSKAKYAYTTGTLGTALETIPYTYGDANWKDKLTSYNGTAITYDAIGNPLNDGSWTYEWAVGRQLKKMRKPNKEIEFKYDFNGLRTQKIVTENGVTTTTNYLLHGKLVTHMTVSNDKLHFFYDNSSRPAKVDFNGTIYTYLHNLQGDIVGILDNAGNLVVEYKYDAWGKLLSTTGSLADTLGIRNPFHYRSYFYDVETGLYYARSRYYVSEWSRFLNADSTKILEETVGQQFGGNLYQYCKNACPIAADEDGNWLNLVIGAIAGAVISAGCQIVSNVVQGKDAMDGVLTAAASGAITGAVAASGVGLMGQVIVGGAVGAGAEFAQQMIDTGGDVDPLNCFVDCVVAGGMGMLSAVIGGNGLLYYKDSVYQNGIRLLNVIRNVERGMYSSAGKAARRLAAVGAEYVSEYIKQATAATVKYTIGATVATALKAPAQNGLKNLIRHLGYRSTFACVSLQVM